MCWPNVSRTDGTLRSKTILACALVDQPAIHEPPTAHENEWMAVKTEPKERPITRMLHSRLREWRLAGRESRLGGGKTGRSRRSHRLGRTGTRLALEHTLI